LEAFFQNFLSYIYVRLLPDNRKSRPEPGGSRGLNSSAGIQGFRLRETPYFVLKPK